MEIRNRWQSSQACLSGSSVTLEAGKSNWSSYRLVSEKWIVQNLLVVVFLIVEMHEILFTMMVVQGLVWI